MIRMRALKWVGFLVCCLIIVAWGASHRWTVRYDHYSASRTWTCIRLSMGDIEIHRYSDYRRGRFAPPVGLSIERAGGIGGIWSWFVPVPLWWLLFVATIPTTLLWYRDRRYPPGHCQQCGYNLTGLPEPRCPECGTEFDPSTVPLAVGTGTEET